MWPPASRGLPPSFDTLLFTVTMMILAFAIVKGYAFCYCSMFLPHHMGVLLWWSHVDTPLPERRAHSLVPLSVSVFAAFLE
jgi:hypothetical protein